MLIHLAAPQGTPTVCREGQIPRSSSANKLRNKLNHAPQLAAGYLTFQERNVPPVIDREDMLELTRRMTPSRTCFDRIAGAYIDAEGEIDESFNIHFLKLSGSEKAHNLSLAKQIPFSRTNDQLKEYAFPKAATGRDSMYLLLNTIRECGLKNDALLDVFYEQMSDGYPMDFPYAIFLFHGTYDIPVKAADKERLGESEEIYDFIICTISPLAGAYEPDDPVFGFLYPAFSDRSADAGKIDIFHADPSRPEEGLLYKLFGAHKK